MFLRMQTEKSMKNYCADIKRLKHALQHADAVLIGAGAGLSVSAGFTYSGARFTKYFKDFSEKYGFQDMYSGGFYPYQTLEEYWAYWSKYVFINRYTDAPKPVYDNLLKQVIDKDYFILTTNVDHCFQKAGVDKKRLFYTQGDYGLFQCSKPCHNKTYYNETTIMQMLERQKNMKIPTELVPKCPVCGAPMAMNLRSDFSFVQDMGWYAARGRYEDFLRQHERSNILFLELGVGGNTPAIIKYPFWQMTADNPNAVYVCVNDKEALCPAEIEKQSICISQDIGCVLSALKK